MTNLAVNIITSGATTPKVSTAYNSGSTHVTVSIESPVDCRVKYHTSHAAASAIQIAPMRLPVVTIRRVWQCGHSKPSE